MQTDYTKPRGKIYKLYICGRSHSSKNYANKVCTAAFKSYDAATLDTAVWAWIVEVAEKPQLLRKYLENAQQILDAHNAPILARITQIEQSRSLQANKIDRLTEMYADVDLKKPDNKDVRALFERLRDQTQALFQELREEEDELRAKLLTHTISTAFIDHWERYAQSLGRGIAQFPFEQKCEALKSLNFTGQLGMDEGQKVLWIYLYDVYADKIQLHGRALQKY